MKDASPRKTSSGWVHHTSGRMVCPKPRCAKVVGLAWAMTEICRLDSDALSAFQAQEFCDAADQHFFLGNLKTRGQNRSFTLNRKENPMTVKARAVSAFFHPR